MTNVRIEVHGQAPDGTHFVLNKLTAINASLPEPKAFNFESQLAFARHTALEISLRWQQYLPNDKIRAVELSGGDCDGTPV